LAVGGPAYVHEAMLLTDHFIIIPEIPMRMSLPPYFNWTAIQDGWMADAALIFRVLDKSSCKDLGSYAVKASYSWHAVNAYEADGRLHVELTWYPDSKAMDGFTDRRHGNLWWYYHGQLRRFSMPIPSLDGSQAGQIDYNVVTMPLTWEPYVSPEFAVVHPGKMWREKTRYIWALATDDAHKDHDWLPHVIKVDMERLGMAPLSFSVGEDFGLVDPYLCLTQMPFMKTMVRCSCCNTILLTTTPPLLLC